MSFSIIIASHGGDYWKHLANRRALPSTKGQGAEVLINHVPDANRAQVRNDLAAQASGDWLVFLDADDELAPGYIAAIQNELTGQDDRLYTPAVSYKNGRKAGKPHFWPVCDLSTGNWMVVGTAISKRLFNDVGGWVHLDSTGSTNEYDDWHLWSRCIQVGAVPVKVPDAVYIAHVERHSQHRYAPQRRKEAWYREVHDLLWAT